MEKKETRQEPAPALVTFSPQQRDQHTRELHLLTGMTKMTKDGT
jgi:hypothetical protein